MGDKSPVADQVKCFDKKNLNKTSTQEKNTLPTCKDIEQEKDEQKTEQTQAAK